MASKCKFLRKYREFEAAQAYIVFEYFIVIGNYERPDYETSTIPNVVPLPAKVTCYHVLVGSNSIRLTDPRCNYVLKLENACSLQIDFEQFYTLCPKDFLQVGPNHRICGSVNTGTTQLVPVNSGVIEISLVRSDPTYLNDFYDLNIRQISCLPPLTPSSPPKPNYGNMGCQDSKGGIPNCVPNACH